GHVAHARTGLERAAAPKQVTPAALLLPWLARQLLHQAARGERAQRLLDAAELGELVHARRARAQLARRLRAAQEQLGQHGLAGGLADAQLLVETVLPL